MSLKHQAFSAIRWTTTATVAKTLLQIGQVAVLARLLTPSDYGLMAIVSLVLSFALLFVDLGLSSAYLQRQQVSDEERSSLFWLNIALAAVVTILVMILSPVLAIFFGDMRLAQPLVLSSLIFLIGALGQQPRITMEKTLNFRPLAVLEIVVAIFGFVAATLAALAGLGIYALVLGGLVTAAASTLLAWVYLSGGWRPKMCFSIANIRPFIGFGSATMVNDAINQINMGLDLLLGGRYLMASQLGLYSIPRNLVLQIQFAVNPIVTRVGFPLIAQIQSDIPRVKSVYLKTLNMTASTNAPLYIGLAFFSSEVVQILLGEKWAAAGDLMRILAIWGYVRSTANPVGSLLMGMGRANLSMVWNAAMFVILPPLLWLGSSHGPEGLAWALLLFSVVMYIPNWYWLVRPVCQAGLIEYAAATMWPLLVALSAVAPAYLIADVFASSGLRLMVGCAVAAPLYFLFSYLGNRDWLSAIMELLGRKKRLA